MPDYGRYCPVSLATEVLADRWTPLIVRELVLGSTRFNDIARGLPGISRTLLAQRLRHLERKGVVERWPTPGARGNEYRLTPAGKDLERVLEALGGWIIEWYFDELRPHEIDAVTLTWWLHRRVDAAEVPPGRVVVQFDHTAPLRQSLWIVFDRGEPSVCTTHPGIDADVVVATTTPVLSAVFNGFRTWADAVRTGELTVAGPPALARALPRFFLWSPFAGATRERAARAG